MSKTEKLMEDILKELNIPVAEIKEYPKVKILNCESVIDDGYEELIGKEFYINYSCESKVGVEHNNEIIWFKSGEYELA